MSQQLYDLTHAVATRRLFAETKPPNFLQVFQTLFLDMKSRLWTLARSSPRVVYYFSDWKIDEAHDCDETNFVTPYILGFHNAVIQLPDLLPKETAEQRTEEMRDVFRKKHDYFQVERLNKKGVAFSFLIDRYCGFTLGLQADTFDTDVIKEAVQLTLKKFCFPLSETPLALVPEPFAQEIYDEIRAEAARR